MPRKPRIEAPGAIHHVVAKGNAGEKIVRDDYDRRTLLRRLARTIELHRWECLSWCLLDTHFHLLVRTPQANLGVGMKWLTSSYALDFNHRHDRQGHVFGGRFYSVVVARDSHFVAALVYVALNPVRAGLVKRPEEWRWSSYASLIGRVPAPPFLARERAFELAGLPQAHAERAFRDAVEAALSLDALARDARGQTPGMPVRDAAGV
jgi:putative transposase